MLAPGDCSPSRRVVSKILIMRGHDFTSLFMRLLKMHFSSKAAGERGQRRRTLRGTSRDGQATENAAGGAFSAVSKTQKPPSLSPGTEASEAPWYHPDLAMNNVRRPQPFITPCHGGEAESITRVSWILAQRRVRRRAGWFAPSTSSLSCCANRVLLLVAAINRMRKNPLTSLSYAKIVLFTAFKTSTPSQTARSSATGASRPPWTEVRRAVPQDQARHTRQR